METHALNYDLVWCVLKDPLISLGVKAGLVMSYDFFCGTCGFFIFYVWFCFLTIVNFLHLFL